MYQPVFTVSTCTVQLLPLLITSCILGQLDIHIICVLSPYQMSPLHWAADGGQLNIVKFLAEKGANLNSKDEGYYGVSE